MKKLLFFFPVLALFAQSIEANPVTLDQAMAIAKGATTSTKVLKGSNAGLKVNYVARNLKGTADYYVFNRDNNQGFVIVAGDDMSTPILGYSDSGSFDFNEAPEPMRMMLQEYQNQMAWLHLHPEAAQKPKITYDLQPYGVYPICGDVHWHQFAPYNNDCPPSTHALTTNGRCYAGCVPVAMATIMKGLRHPYRGFGENSYTLDIEGREVTVSANFDRVFKYSDMKNGYGTNAYNAQEVSRFMFEVGVAFNAKFSGESTDVAVKNVVRAMIANFDYNPNMQYVMKSSYSYNLQAWYDMIYAEIDGGRPVCMFGYRTLNNNGGNCYTGHAFVIDGYDREGKVHVNWGFEPDEYNTYFDLTMLSPRYYSTGDDAYQYDPEKSGFNTDQAAIIGLCPDTTSMGGVVVKSVNLVADTMPVNDIRATIDVQALSGSWNGTLRYGIVSKTSDGYSRIHTAVAEVNLDENGVATLDLSGEYPSYYMYEGRTYYIVVWSPYFSNSMEWNWFLCDPVPFTIGDWVTPPDPQFLLGDVNNDGIVSIKDVTDLIDYLLGGSSTEINMDAANVNGDETVSISDATTLIDQLLANGGGDGE